MPANANPGADSEAPRRPGESHVRAARLEKRARAEAVGIDAEYISRFVDRFYGHIRHDALLGPIFEARISDWDEHLGRMKRFWRSVLHNSGEFSGNPMVKHLAIPGLGLSHFVHWLELFYATLREDEPHPEATKEVGARALMIADSLLTGIELNRTGLAGARAGRDLPHV